MFAEAIRLLFQFCRRQNFLLAFQRRKASPLGDEAGDINSPPVSSLPPTLMEVVDTLYSLYLINNITKGQLTQQKKSRPRRNGSPLVHHADPVVSQATNP